MRPCARQELLRPRRAVWQQVVFPAEAVEPLVAFLAEHGLRLAARVLGRGAV